MGAAAPIIAIAATVLSTAVATAGSIQQGRAAQAQANYQSQVAENNSIIAQQKADDARARGAIEERQQRIRTAQLIGAQRAGAAARGVVVDEGSALDITTDTAGIGELDALTIRSNAEREARGFEQEGLEFRSEAQLRQMAGRSARSDSLFSAGGTILSGASAVSDRWYKLR